MRGKGLNRQRGISNSIQFEVKLPSLKLTKHLKFDGWKTTFLLARPVFRCYCRVLCCFPHMSFFISFDERVTFSVSKIEMI